MKLIIASLLLVAVTGQFTDNNNSTEDRRLSTEDQKKFIKLTLYNAQNPDGVQIWPTAPESWFVYANEMKYKPLKVFMHGFFSKATKYHKDKAITTRFLEQGDPNVILVSWRKLAKGGDGLAQVPLYPEYVKAAGYAMDVGEFLADWLIENIYPNIVNLDLHLIGHSLGAQGVGRAGRLLTSRGRAPTRVTGLDPAGPLFDFGWNNEFPTWTKIRGLVPIGRDSGEFVDIIHSNAGAMGARRTLGHQDFYLNGGLRIQKCFYKYGNNLWGDKKSHSYSTELFIETIADPYKYPSLQCWGEMNFAANTNQYPICSAAPDGAENWSNVNYLGMGARPWTQSMSWLTDVSTCTNDDPEDFSQIWV